jgi:hypothetical protein
MTDRRPRGYASSQPPRYNFTQRPTALRVRLSGIPGLLRDLPDAWAWWEYVWRESRWKKPPREPGGGRYLHVDHHSGWSSFARALDWYGRELRCYRPDGVGLVLRQEHRLLGLDLDRAVRGGAVVAWALKVLDAFRGAHVEFSPSGLGLRLLCCYGGPPVNRIAEMPEGGRLEVYTDSRFLSITGSTLENGEVDEELQVSHDAVDWLLASLPTPPLSEGTGPASGNGLDDAEVLDLMARSRPKQHYLYLTGDHTGAGFNDRSSAHTSLIESILYYTGPDPVQAERIFLGSAFDDEKVRRPGYVSDHLVRYQIARQHRYHDRGGVR